MVFYVIPVIIIFVTFVSKIIQKEIESEKKHNEMIQDYLRIIRSKIEPPAESYSASGYLERMEKYCLSLNVEPEPYLITLLWGYDGLRMNDDGTTEWISIRPVDTPHKFEARTAQASADESIRNAIWNSWFSETGDSRICSSLHEIELLNCQMQTIQSQLLQQQQMYQTQNIISQLNALRQPSYYPHYISSQLPLQNSYWNPYLLSCCCGTIDTAHNNKTQMPGTQHPGNMF